MRKRPFRLLLAFTPPVMLSLAIPLVNRLEPKIFGLPFLLAWILVWILLTPLFYWTIYAMDRRK